MKAQNVTIYKRSANETQMYYFTERTKSVIFAPEMVIVANGFFDGKRTIKTDNGNYSVTPRTDWVEKTN